MQDNQRCEDCRNDVSRRDFIQTVSGAALVASTQAWWLPTTSNAAPTPKSTAETAVTQFYGTLTDTQKKAICFPFNHPKRKRISANWHITDPTIDSDFYSVEQRGLIKEIFKGVTSEDGAKRLLQQMDDDAGGMGEYSVAVFGEPGTGKFEWEMTGRHLTLRADGDSVENVAFGGPIVYGHALGDPADNLFFYQTKKANEVFKALDAKQQKRALLSKAPEESKVPLQGAKGVFPGIAVGELSSDQQDLVESVIKVILAPYREEDVKEALALLKAGGGLEKLHMTFYEQEDLNADQVWDIWRVEGPSFVWHFRGAPHVHTYVNIGKAGA